MVGGTDLEAMLVGNNVICILFCGDIQGIITMQISTGSWISFQNNRCYARKHIQLVVAFMKDIHISIFRKIWKLAEYYFHEDIYVLKNFCRTSTVKSNKIYMFLTIYRWLATQSNKKYICFFNIVQRDIFCSSDWTSLNNFSLIKCVL